jgi:hypothetical protein
MPGVFHTPMFALHPMLRNALANSSLFTNDCEIADAIFVMYDVGTDTLVAKNGSRSAHLLKFWTNRTTYMPLIKSKLHIMVISRVELELRGCSRWEYGGPFLCAPESFENVVYLTIEKKLKGGVDSHHNALEVPYPSKMHPGGTWNGVIDYKEKDVKVFATFSPRTPLRKVLARQCGNQTADCTFCYHH